MSEKLESSEILELAKGARDGKIEVVIRRGDAQVLLPEEEELEIRPLELQGNIETVHNFLSVRHELFKPDLCNIYVSINDLTIFFTGNEQRIGNEHTTTVLGRMKKSKKFESLPLDQSFLPKEFAKFVRKNKGMFASAKEWEVIFKEYSNFQAKINKEIESSKDNSGNSAEVAIDKVVHNLIQELYLFIPLVKGGKPVTVKLEIDIESNNGALTCSLFAADIEEKFEAQALEILNAELEKEVDGKPMREFCVTYFK